MFPKLLKFFKEMSPFGQSLSISAVPFLIGIAAAVSSLMTEMPVKASPNRGNISAIVKQVELRPIEIGETPACRLVVVVEKEETIFFDAPGSLHDWIPFDLCRRQHIGEEIKLFRSNVRPGTYILGIRETELAFSRGYKVSYFLESLPNSLRRNPN